MFLDMSGNIMVGNYFRAKSNIHNMNPISKIICTLLFLIMTIFSFDLEVTGILVILMMILIMNTNIPLSIYSYIIKQLKYLFFIIFIIFSLLTLSIITGLTITINAILIVLILSILTLTTPPTEIVYGLEKVLKPLEKLNIKTNKLSLNISMGLRFIPLVIDESNKLLKSFTSRGLNYKANVKNRLIAIKTMIKPAVKKTIIKQQKIRKNMELRLFSIYNSRTNYRINKWSFFDTYLIIVHMAILIIIIMRGVIT